MTDSPSSAERDLGRVEGKVDLMLSILQAIHAKVEGTEAKHDTLAGRVSTLERRVAVALVAGAVSALAYFCDAKTALASILHMIL